MECISEESLATCGCLYNDFVCCVCKKKKYFSRVEDVGPEYAGKFIPFYDFVISKKYVRRKLCNTTASERSIECPRLVSCGHPKKFICCSCLYTMIEDLYENKMSTCLLEIGF